MRTSWNTSLADSDRAVAEDLHDWMWSNVRMQAAIGSTDEIPAWYGRLLSTITLLVDGAEIEAVFSETDGEAGPVSVSVIAKTRIIRASADTAREISARTFSRSRITAVEALEAGRLFSPSRATWPAIPHISVRVDGEADPLLLPSPSSPTRAPDMGALLRGFLGDLDSASGV